MVGLVALQMGGCPPEGPTPPSPLTPRGGKESGPSEIIRARAAGTTYSRLMEGLKAAQCALDRKMIADLAAQDAAAFGELIQMARNALKAKASAKA